MHCTSGVTRLDGARGKKQVWRPVFQPEIFRNQMYCLEEITCDIVGTLRRPRSHSAAPQRYGARGIVPPLPHVLTPLHCTKNS